MTRKISGAISRRTSMKPMKISGMTMPSHRVGDQRHARVDHGVELAHVVGGPRHDVADALAVVEGLALAQQADVELLARVPFQPLGQRLDGEGVDDVRHPADQYRKEDEQRVLEQGHRVRVRLEHLVEGAAGHRRDRGEEQRSRHAGDQKADQVALVAQQVREDPAHRAGPVVVVLAGNAELTLGWQGLSGHECTLLGLCCCCEHLFVEGNDSIGWGMWSMLGPNRLFCRR